MSVALLPHRLRLLAQRRRIGVSGAADFGSFLLGQPQHVRDPLAHRLVRRRRGTGQLPAQRLHLRVDRRQLAGKVRGPGYSGVPVGQRDAYVGVEPLDGLPDLRPVITSQHDLELADCRHLDHLRRLLAIHRRTCLPSGPA